MELCGLFLINLILILSVTENWYEMISNGNRGCNVLNEDQIEFFEKIFWSSWTVSSHIRHQSSQIQRCTCSHKAQWAQICWMSFRFVSPRFLSLEEETYDKNFVREKKFGQSLLGSKHFWLIQKMRTTYQIKLENGSDDARVAIWDMGVCWRDSWKCGGFNVEATGYDRENGTIGED